MRAITFSLLLLPHRHDEKTKRTYKKDGYKLYDATSKTKRMNRKANKSNPYIEAREFVVGAAKKVHNWLEDIVQDEKVKPLEV